MTWDGVSRAIEFCPEVAVAPEAFLPGVVDTPWTRHRLVAAPDRHRVGSPGRLNGRDDLRTPQIADPWAVDAHQAEGEERMGSFDDEVRRQDALQRESASSAEARYHAARDQLSRSLTALVPEFVTPPPSPGRCT